MPGPKGVPKTPEHRAKLSMALKKAHAEGRHGSRIDGRSGYRVVHFKVIRERGKASDHSCVDCGQPAHEWSYDHADTNARRASGYQGLVFSDDPARYEPRCRSCHRRFDAMVAAAIKRTRERVA